MKKFPKINFENILDVLCYGSERKSLCKDMDCEECVLDEPEGNRLQIINRLKESIK